MLSRSDIESAARQAASKHGANESAARAAFATAFRTLPGNRHGLGPESGAWDWALDYAAADMGLTWTRAKRRLAAATTR